MKKGAVQWWIIAQPERAALTNQLKEMAGKGDEARDYKDTKAMQDEFPCAQRHFNDYLHDQPLCNLFQKSHFLMIGINGALKFVQETYSREKIKESCCSRGYNGKAHDPFIDIDIEDSRL